MWPMLALVVCLLPIVMWRWDLAHRRFERPLGAEVDEVTGRRRFARRRVTVHALETESAPRLELITMTAESDGVAS